MLLLIPNTSSTVQGKQPWPPGTAWLAGVRLSPEVSWLGTHSKTTLFSCGTWTTLQNTHTRHLPERRVTQNMCTAEFYALVKNKITLSVCLLLLWWNAMTKNNLGRKIYLAYMPWSQSIINERQQAPKRKPWGTLVTGVTVPLPSRVCSPCFLIQLRTTCPGWHCHLSTVDWALPHQSWIQKMPPQTCLQVNIMEIFSQLRFLLPRWPKLCQVDRKLSSTGTGSLTKIPDIPLFQLSSDQVLSQFQSFSRQTF